MKHPLGERLLAIAIAVSIVGIIVAAAMTVANQDLRCHLGLDDCPADPQPSASHREPSPPAPKPPTFVDVAPREGEPWLSFAEPDPSPAGPVTVTLEQHEIANRGTPVVIPLRASGFHGMSYAEIEWNMPNGSTYKGLGADVAPDGTLDYALYWWPMQWAGISGNNGRWPITVKDRLSDSAVTTYVDVHSDDDTPPPSEWPTDSNWTPPATGTPHISVEATGDLCTAGRRVELTVAGYPPEDNVTISYLRTDDGRIGSHNPSADGIGYIRNIVITFFASDCTHDYMYQVVAVGRDGHLARADIPLSG